MPADAKQRRTGTLRIALGIEFAGRETISMVMLSVFLSCAVRVSRTGISGTDEARGLDADGFCGRIRSIARKGFGMRAAFTSLHVIDGFSLTMAFTGLA